MNNEQKLELVKKLAKMGQAKVAAKLAQGKFTAEEAEIAKEWLTAKGGEVPEAPKEETAAPADKKKADKAVPVKKAAAAKKDKVVPTKAAAKKADKKADITPTEGVTKEALKARTVKETGKSALIRKYLLEVDDNKVPTRHNGEIKRLVEVEGKCTVYSSEVDRVATQLYTAGHISGTRAFTRAAGKA